MNGFVAVHTGAGNNVDESKYQNVIKEACCRATEIFKNGGTAMDACEVAIMHLENSSNTNAGFGSNLCWDGYVQCDASIMDGSTLHFGACTNVSTVKNPIQFARKLCDSQSKKFSMERIPPMIMAGSGAESYAQQLNCTMVDANSLISSKAELSYNYYKSKYDAVENLALGKRNSSNDNVVVSDIIASSVPPPLDTVGAVCVDANGNTAAGCSSGGIILKMAGRVGQAGIYGAGCWAIDTDALSVATCTTGNGEYLIKTLLAKEISMDLLTNDCPVTSIHNTFKTKFLESPFLPDLKELYGGALSLVYHSKDTCGELLWSQTTKSFCLGYMSTQQKVPKFIYSSLPTYSEPGKSCAVNGYNFHLRI